jgi:F420-dependent methylenetetrahydromethanopterin dehydrogenase
MGRYLLNSAILRSGTDPKACATGAAKMLTSGKIKDISVKSCFCCSDQKRVAFILEAPSSHAVLDAMEKIDLPVASITEIGRASCRERV